MPTGVRGAGAEYVLIEDELACRCVASPTVLERVPVLYGVDFLRTDSFTRPEVPLLLSKPKNSMVRVTWRPLDLAEEGRIVAYSLLGYEYLQQDVRKGVTAVFIDTRQLLSGIYVVRLETLDGHPLGSARLVVEHPMQDNHVISKLRHERGWNYSSPLASPFAGAKYGTASSATR